jgi:hypothetical protein
MATRHPQTAAMGENGSRATLMSRHALMRALPLDQEQRRKLFVIINRIRDLVFQFDIRH